MSRLPDFTSVRDIRFGASPELDAMLLHFMTENGLEYTIDPVKNASPEQVRFMVALAKGVFYAPCSDWMLLQLLKQGMTPELREHYLDVWRSLVRVVRETVPDRDLRRRIIHLSRHKFRMAYNASILIPSRLMKRMLTILLTQSGVDDPYRQRKLRRNAMALKIVTSEDWDRIVNACPAEVRACERLDALRADLGLLEIKRLIAMSTVNRFDDVASYFTSLGDVDKEMDALEEGFAPLGDLLGPQVFGTASTGPLKILLIPSGTGSIILDLKLCRALVRQGHRVVFVLKEGFYFDYDTFWDAENDAVVAEALEGVRLVSELNLSKNDLLQEMREQPFVVISDGTRERFNPYRMSVTLARAWKECDLVLTEGYGNYRRVFETEHDFTRDIFSFWRDKQGALRVFFRPRDPGVRKFSERYILSKAGELIAGMRRAQEAGQSVMFYSGIIGSVPGQTKVAIKVINTFVAYLRERLDDVHIINPGEHFEEGMDADDLMFMWEKVQRSGYLDVWRFQTVADIEKSFELMGMKVPPIWAGKDATYSTGCTKEMNIALDVQRKYRELQIIGPSAEQFFRRREYGVGKFCDVAIDGCGV
jgi:uncharacterized protein with ATP-grasp and redox domains